MKPSRRCALEMGLDNAYDVPGCQEVAKLVAKHTGCDELLEAASSLVENPMSKQLWANLAEVVAKHAPPTEPAPKLVVTATKERLPDEYDGSRYDRISLTVATSTDTFLVLTEHADEIIRRLTDDRPRAKPGLNARLAEHRRLIRDAGLPGLDKWDDLDREIRKCCLGEEPAEGETG